MSVIAAEGAGEIVLDDRHYLVLEVLRQSAAPSASRPAG
jgi:hypothetical protein